MKIALPLADGKLCMHFGHCEIFAIVEVDDIAKTITCTRSHPKTLQISIASIENAVFQGFWDRF